MKKETDYSIIIFLLLSTLIIILNVFLMYLRFIQIYPLSPWDAGIIVEAFRLENNQAVYEDLITGHATHMYGWFYNYVLWFFFNLFGFNNFLPRVITLIAAFSLISSLTFIICRKEYIYKILLIWVLFFSINFNIDNYYIYGRPDVLAALFAVLSTILIYRSYYKNSYLLLICSLLLLILSYSTKQTFAFICVIPALSFFLLKDFNKTSIIYAVAPIITLILTVLFIYLFKPYYYFYMMTLPGAYDIRIGKLFYNILFLVFGTPIFIYLFLYWKFQIKKGYKNKLLTWSIASIILSIIVSSLSTAKAGGAYNSNLPAYICIYFFCGLVLIKNINDFAEINISSAGKVLWAILISILVLISTFSVISKIVVNNNILLIINFTISIIIYIYMYRYKDNFPIWNYKTEKLKIVLSGIFLISSLSALFTVYKVNNFFTQEYKSYINRVNKKNYEYSEIIKTSKQLKGVIISPEDPTIVLYSKNLADRSMDFERDSNPHLDRKFPEVPGYLTEYITSADYIVNVKDNKYLDTVKEKDLKRLNFIKMDEGMSDFKYYTLWKNNKIK